MMKIAMIAASAAMFALLPAANSLAAEMPTADQCTAWFTKADTNGDGSLGKGENAKYIEMMTKTSTTTMDADEALAKDAWLAECAKGTFGMPSE